MKRNLKFEINYDINYTLIGLRSKTEDYQFAYSLNKSSLFLKYAKYIEYVHIQFTIAPSSSLYPLMGSGPGKRQ